MRKGIARVVESTPCRSEGFKWLGLRRLKYVDEDGGLREWESTERTTRNGDVDGVSIVAKISRAGVEPMVVLVSQFRPPTNAYVFELPAGLVDQGETCEQAAIRELREETGYVGSVSHVSPVLFADPGMSNANMRIVTVDVDGDSEENQNPQPQQEENEYIETYTVPLKDLVSVLAQPKVLVDPKQQDREFVVCSRLYSIALGLNKL
mmetsp:Transcript_10561/g.17237  ORF Transcript_10561/g.17237 Transcript_10561/m.17237 type:complete len:207 (-) Transcript_10561:1175-1795(-)